MQHRDNMGFAKRARSLPIQRSLPFVAVALSCVLSSVLGLAVVYKSTIAVLIIAATFVLNFMRCSALLIVCTAVFLTAATYRGLFLAFRVTIGGGPVSIYDVLWILVLIKVLPLSCQRKGDCLTWPMMLFASWSVVTAGIGLLFHQQLYDISKYLRADCFLVTGYLAVRMLPMDRRIDVLRVFVLGGTTTAILQIVTFAGALRGFNIWAVLGVNANPEGAYFNASDLAYNTAALRDNGVNIGFALLASLILISGIATTRHLFRQSTEITLLTVCLIGILLSLTRSAVLILIIGVIAILILGGRVVIRHIAILSTLGFTVLLLFGSYLYVVGTSAAPVLIPVVTRFSGLRLGTQDQTINYRLDETSQAWQILNGRWWYGIGAVSFATPQPDGTVLIHSQLHNGYLQALVNGGIIGLSSIVLLLLVGLVSSWNTAKHASDEENHFLGLVSLSCILTFAIAAYFGGAVNDAFQTPIIGLFLGFAVSSSVVAHRTLYPRSAPRASEHYP